MLVVEDAVGDRPLPGVSAEQLVKVSRSWFMSRMRAEGIGGSGRLILLWCGVVWFAGPIGSIG